MESGTSGRPFDLVIRRARRPGDDAPVDVAMRDGVIAAVGPDLTGAVHACQMSGEHEIGRMYEAVTVNGARTMGLEGYGLEVGCRADAVLLDAESMPEALRAHPARLAVIRAGQVVAETEAARRTVVAPALAGPVHFRQPAFR